ncbi:phosphatases II, partial [Fomitiporia mediterranea MF3/22]
LLKNSITHVLVVGKGLKVEDDLSPEITVKRVDLLDLESVRIEDYLDDLCGFVEEGTRGNNKILVHCLFGMSRSVVVVIDYLHRYKGIGMFNAFYFVATGRPQINLNAGFKRYVI